MSFIDSLKKRRLFFEGGMGTILIEKGLSSGEIPESWNIKHPEIIKNIHKEYINAGADILKINTFGANEIKLKNTPYTVEELISSAIEIAKSAANETDREVFIALDIGPTGKLLKPLGDLSFEDSYKAFAKMVKEGEKNGADLILIETFGDTYELKSAVLAAKENSSLPVIATVMTDESGKMLTGASIEAIGALLSGLKVDALGLNCGVGPKQMIENAKKLSKFTSLPLVFNPNAGLPKGDIFGNTTYDVSPKEFAKTMKKFAKFSNVLGGCCGTTPEHIKELISATKEISLPKQRKFNKTVICSGMKAVTIGEKAIIIGERINPTGKKLLKQALKENNIDYILQEGVLEEDEGADVLDVNVGLPEIDEPKMMETVIKALQSVVSVPLQIDTSDTVAMEKALRIVNGKPIINSVNGKLESMNAIFPLVKKYGGVVIGLTIDETGIPKTAKGRFEIAKKIVSEAKKYGIMPNDIIIDTLAMTISTGEDAMVTLDAIKMVKKLGVKTVLGVSNISFGLPKRENVNSSFFAMALNSGLDAAIINPHSQTMMQTFYSSMALLKKDENCKEYIRFCEASQTVEKTNSLSISLYDAIIKGLSKEANNCTKNELKSKKPLDIVSEILVPALDFVGKAFEEGKMFLPQLLMSAEAAKSAFFEIQKLLLENGDNTAKTDKIVLATVKGDIHDIGKNIVKVLLENYGYDCIDLGKDVEPKLVLDAVKKHNVKLVGLSALMTTTVPNMAETIKLIHDNAPWCKVVVGGAVLTKEYAKLINADEYSAEAMATVRYANKIFNK